MILDSLDLLLQFCNRTMVLTLNSSSDQMNYLPNAQCHCLVPLSPVEYHDWPPLAISPKPSRGTLSSKSLHGFISSPQTVPTSHTSHHSPPSLFFFCFIVQQHPPTQQDRFKRLFCCVCVSLWLKIRKGATEEGISEGEKR